MVYRSRGGCVPVQRWLCTSPKSLDAIFGKEHALECQNFRLAASLPGEPNPPQTPSTPALVVGLRPPPRELSAFGRQSAFGRRRPPLSASSSENRPIQGGVYQEFFLGALRLNKRYQNRLFWRFGDSIIPSPFSHHGSSNPHFSPSISP